jgi:hypothetical protein
MDLSGNDLELSLNYYSKRSNNIDKYMKRFIDLTLFSLLISFNIIYFLIGYNDISENDEDIEYTLLNDTTNSILFILSCFSYLIFSFTAFMIFLRILEKKTLLIICVISEIITFVLILCLILINNHLSDKTQWFYLLYFYLLHPILIGIVYYFK